MANQTTPAFGGRRATSTAVAPSEEIVGWVPAPRGSMPPPTDEDEPNQSMPIVGEIVVVMNTRWRCVSVSWADEQETKGQPELRVRFKAVGP